MPLPIKPVNELTEHNELFGTKTDNETRGDISALQAIFLGENTREASKPKYSEQTLHTLEEIYNSVDKLSTVATEYANPHREASVLYNVPKSITDNDLLSLKTAGLIVGMGRSVKLTEHGRIALRDKWLGETNQFENNRTKEKFDIKTAENSKFKRIVTGEQHNER